MLNSTILREKTILITGGGTGLGQAMGCSFLEHGAKGIVITGRREEMLTQTLETWRRDFPQAKLDFVVCDIRDPSSVERMISKSIAEGKCNVVVNNAAGNFLAQTKDISHRALDAVLGTVLHGTAYVTLAAGKQWIQQNTPGVFLNIVTTYAQSGSAFVLPSAMGKAGVLAMTRSLAVEWAPYGIRSVAVAPGPIPTQGAWSRLLPVANLEQKMKDKNPLKRFGKPEELGHLATFLISDLAAYINGDCITIDGGEWLQGAGQFTFAQSLSQNEWDEFRQKKN